MTSRTLTLAEIAEIGRKPRKTATRKGISPASVQCNHDWQPDESLFAKGDEYPTKRCMTCNVRIICKPDEIIEAINIGEWLVN